jgi:hypothetical protein
LDHSAGDSSIQIFPAASRRAERGRYPGFAYAMDAFFWALIAQAVQLPKAQLTRQIDSATYLIYHALFTDRPSE